MQDLAARYLDVMMVIIPLIKNGLKIIKDSALVKFRELYIFVLFSNNTYLQPDINRK
jgi:hypothetical protein